MKNKIDQYFKNILNTPQEPPSDAWEYIKSRIPKEEKKRFIPLWARLSGIAALLLFLVGGSYMLNLFEFNSNQNSSENQNPSNFTKGNSTSDGAVEIWTPANSNPENLNQVDQNRSSYPINGQNKTYSFKNQPNTNHNSQFIQNHSQKAQSDYNSTLNNTNSSSQLSETSQILDQNQNNMNWDPILGQPKIAWNNLDWEKEMSTPNLQNLAENPINNPHSEKLEIEESELLALNSEENKKEKSKNDFKKKPEFDRFYISGFVSPMALNTFVGSSMLADDMSQYKTENNITLAYGLKGAYAVSPKIKIRTGVSVIGFEQITKNVPLSVSVENGAMASRHDAKNNVQYNGNLRIDNTQAASLVESELNNKTLNGDIQQQSQYIEIPVEAEVNLFQTNSIGISATAGGSTWLLSKNKIFAHTDEYTEELGKAENLNNTSFSANAGLKFDMKISETVNVNVEPAFKYLINPVSDIEKYNPYTVGVNAGVTVSLK